MENPRYIDLMRRTASDYDGVSQELFKVAHNIETVSRYNPQNKLLSLCRIAETSTVQLRNLTARTVIGERALFYAETAQILGVKVEEFHDWIKISVPAILPKRNQRDNQAFLVRPLRQALIMFLRENPIERFAECAICIVHKYDEALGTLRVRDYDNIETKKYLDVIESMLLTNDSGLLCSVLQCTEISDRDETAFYLMPPEKLLKWLATNWK